MISKLHYISQAPEGGDHLWAIAHACKAGCDWVQLRMKDVSEEEYLEVAYRAKAICQTYQAKLIVNDKPEVALAVKADGVHLGKEDMHPKEARALLGPDFIIGATANTTEDIERAVLAGADYVGVGPFRFTKTKKKLSHILGQEGFAQIFEWIKQKEIRTPIVAIGGIVEEDVHALRQLGVHGIAISGLITCTPAQQCADLVKRLSN